jgi:hypothetical protein|tara:strand:- start:108 stop:419 length:312 start_codon:yes stop_codon:yes gene_type:complete
MSNYDTTTRSANWQADVSVGDKRIRYAFDNKWEVSLLWGENSYGEANELGEAVSYEVAVFTPNGDFLALTEYDDVIGHRSWDAVKFILEKVNDGNAIDLELNY